MNQKVAMRIKLVLKDAMLQTPTARQFLFFSAKAFQRNLKNKNVIF